MKLPKVDWLLSGEPREVQWEVLRRSYTGVAFKDSSYDINSIRPIINGSKPPFVGFGYFLEMRLGKTPALLNEFMLYRRDRSIKRLVVLAPNKFKPEWPLEAERFGIGLPSLSFESTKRGALERFIKESNEFILAINYEALISKTNMEMFESICDSQTMIAADESISIKNPRSMTFKAAMRLAKACGVRRILTGKPISQGAHDLYAQLRFIGALDGVNFFAFRNTYCIMGGFQGKQIVGTKNEDKLADLLSKYTFSARKSEWLHTGGVDYTTRKIDLSSEQKRLYKRMFDDSVADIDAERLVTAEQAITRLIKLQQVTSGFLIDENKQLHELIEPKDNPKIKEVLSILEEEVTTKVIIVCHFTFSVNALKLALAPYQPAEISGRISESEVTTEKARFNNDPNCRVLIGQTRSLRYGHTLMGSKESPCYTTIFYENSYSLNDRSQCEERNQGQGQDVPITIIDFISAPIDSDAIRALQRKEDVASVLLKYDRATGILPKVL